MQPTTILATGPKAVAEQDTVEVSAGKGRPLFVHMLRSTLVQPTGTGNTDVYNSVYTTQYLTGPSGSAENDEMKDTD